MKRYLLILFASLSMVSCEKYDEEILPVVGVYEAHVLGLTGPVSISVSVDHGQHIFIEAPFDGFEWIVANAKIDNKEESDKEITIKRQWVGSDVEIWGHGVFYQGSIQLDYTMSFDEEEYDFTLIGTKY